MRIVRLIIGGLITFPFVLMSVLLWVPPLLRWRRRWLARLRPMWARLVLWLLRIRVRVEPPGVNTDGPALYVANHTGYLDILVVMSVSPGAFISREGIFWWPVLGQLTALGDTIFVDRRRRLSIGRSIDKIHSRLRLGVSIVVFPEATSANGDGLLPFRSPLFAVVTKRDGREFPVRPLVVRYLTVAGQPIDESNRDRVYWYGDMSLPKHIWHSLTAPGIEVAIKPLPERVITGDRKEFASSLREEMLRELEIPGTAG